MAAQITRSRLLDLMKVQCSIFSTTYNPNGIRTGNKVLRQRLRGPTLAAYYPRKTATPEDLRNSFKKYDMDMVIEEEEDRLESIAVQKMRGKGAPKKKREKDVSVSKRRK